MKVSLLSLSLLAVVGCASYTKNSKPETERDPAAVLGPGAAGALKQGGEEGSGVRLPPGTAAQKAAYAVVEPDSGSIVQFRKVSQSFEGFTQDVILVEFCEEFAELPNCKPKRTERIPYHSFVNRVKMMIRTGIYPSFPNTSGTHTSVADANKGADPKMIERTRILSEERAEWRRQAEKMEKWLQSHKVQSAEVNKKIAQLKTLIGDHTRTIESNDSLKAAADALDGFVNLIMGRLFEDQVYYLVNGKDSAKMEFILLAALREPAPLVTSFATIQKGAFQRYAAPRIQITKSEDAVRPGEPLGTVEISEPFEIGTTEITQYDYFRVMGSKSKVNPAKFQGSTECRDKVTINGVTMCPLNPMENLSRADVEDFLANLNQMDGAHTYRLPTEAEWELAARGSSTYRYAFNATNPEEVDLFAWSRENTGGTSTLPVGLKTKNANALFDIHGNVAELVLPVYSCRGGDRRQQQKKQQQVTVLKNPKACEGSDRALARGGAFLTAWTELQLDYSQDAALPASHVGFRVIREKR